MEENERRWRLRGMRDGFQRQIANHKKSIEAARMVQLDEKLKAILGPDLDGLRQALDLVERELAELNK